MFQSTVKRSDNRSKSISDVHVLSPKKNDDILVLKEEASPPRSAILTNQLKRDSILKDDKLPDFLSVPAVSRKEERSLTPIKLFKVRRNSFTPSLVGRTLVATLPELNLKYPTY